jgi:hypothetical protein
MKYKTQVLCDKLVAALSALPEIECISLNEAALSDTLDPYFALILDVFYKGSIIEPDQRKLFFSDKAAANLPVEMFETSRQGAKDRFLIGDIPIRVEYKSLEKMDRLIAIADNSEPDSLWMIKDRGTYTFYRLTNGQALFNRSGWIDGARARLGNLGARFWDETRAAQQLRMEHLLNDFGAALFQADDFNYHISSALFIKHALLTLFCVNHTFEPSHRHYAARVLALPVLPESFSANFENFIRNDGAIDKERKYSLAKVIARGIVAL